MNEETKIQDLEKKVNTNEEKLGNIMLKIRKLQTERDILERKLLNQRASLANLKAKAERERAKTVERMAEELK